MDTNEKIKKSGILKVIVLLILIVLVTALVGFAYARYIARINGQVTAQIANYNFDVTVGNSTNLNIDLANTRLANDTTKVASGQVAPDTKGAFNLNIDATGSNVTLIYNIDLDLSGTPENLKFYSDANMKKEVMVQDNKIKIEDCIGINDSKTKTISLYWQWPYETGENDYEIGLNDVKDSAWMGRDIEIAVSATSKQAQERVTYLADSVSIGDYVNYDATSGDGAGLSITPTSDLTGINTTTTFNSSDITGWRVYDVDSVTKTVTLIAQDPTNSVLRLRGSTGWKNVISVLNSIGAIYGHGNGAKEGRSIQEKDISLYSTYNPVNYYNGHHKTGDVLDGYYYYTGNANRFETEVYTDGMFIMDDYSEVYATTSNPVTVKQTYYAYTSVANYIPRKRFILLFNKSLDTSQSKLNFWIAWRGKFLDGKYSIYRINYAETGAIRGASLYTSNGSESSIENAVLPMVTLQSNIQITGQDSNNVWLLNVE